MIREAWRRVLGRGQFEGRRQGRVLVAEGQCRVLCLRARHLERGAEVELLLVVLAVLL